MRISVWSSDGCSSDLVDDVNPLEWVNWLLSRKPTLRPSTWRYYRQSLIATVSALPHEDTEAALALLEADVNAGAEVKPPPIPGECLPRRTSALKEKRFPKDAFDKIIHNAQRFSRSKLAPVIVDWLIAGIDRKSTRLNSSH